LDANGSLLAAAGRGADGACEGDDVDEEDELGGAGGIEATFGLSGVMASDPAGLSDKGSDERRQWPSK